MRERLEQHKLLRAIVPEIRGIIEGCDRFFRGERTIAFVECGMWRERSLFLWRSDRVWLVDKWRERSDSERFSIIGRIVLYLWRKISIMNAHKLAVTLLDDGNLHLKGLPFQAGDTVEIIILEQGQKEFPSQPLQVNYPLQGTVLRYDDPFEPAVVTEDWDALR